MGDSSLYGFKPTHPYTSNSSPILSEQLHVRKSVVALSQAAPPAPPPSLVLHYHLRAQPYGRAPRPTLFSPHPLQQSARLDYLPYIEPSSSPFPAVIVSPHFHTPTRERDSSPPSVKHNFTKSTTAGRQQLDGNKENLQGVHGSAPSMTANGVPTMLGKRDDKAMFPRNQRPSIVSHHSSSVPSTPLQLPRQYESRSRSPSPSGGLGSHSPRSVSSEANGPMATLRAGRPEQKCKFESTATFGRRRMPYTSSDVLDGAKEEPKKTLDPDEDDKLSGDMRELYDRLLPDQQSKDKREGFVRKLDNILHTEWPGDEFKVHVFGSSGNLLYTSESDVDVCIQTPMRKLEEVHMLAAALDKHGMQKVVCIPQAKVRIVKVWDPELNLACDMNVNNTLALENTRMIKTYVQIDERVRPLAMIIKHWTKQRILNDAALGGTISSYTWICMILNFLQTRDPPILPSLHRFNQGTNDTSQCGFTDDLDQLKGFGGANKESLGQLLFHFFRRYGHEIDYEKFVISVREGRLLTREEKEWEKRFLTKEARNRLCVEEPFNTSRNLGNSADEFAWRGIHLEIRRAFELLADGQQLDKACEQYEFPPEEKVTFKKPTSSVKTVLQNPTMRSGRGGSGHRGGRGNFHQKNSHGYGRRASSGASFGANRPPLLNSPPISGMSNQEYFPRGLNEQLHDQLFQQYQMLEMQSNSLRAQLAAQQRAQQAHQVQAAHMHAQAVAQAQAQARGQGSVNGSPQKSPFVTGRASPRLGDVSLPPSAIPQFLYPYPGFFEPTQGVVAAPQDGTRTNPSSPSLTHSQPGLRRAVHRASNASDTGSIRSQSQPPRGITPQNLIPSYHQVPPYFDPSTFAGYPIARSTQEAQSSQATSDSPYSPLSQNPETAPSSDHGTPKEYVGYYVAEEPQPRPQLQDYAVPQIPSFSELRRRRVSSEITQPLLNTALRRVSRSPSPLGGHMRSFSIGVTAPPNSSAQQRGDRSDATPTNNDSGPVIANGSFPMQPRSSRDRSGTLDSYTADVANQSALGIFLNNNDQYRPPAEEMHRERALDAKGAGLVNGSTRTSPVEANNSSRVSSNGQPSFPGLPDTWMNFNMINGEKTKYMDAGHSTEVSPTRSQPTQWRPLPLPNGLSTLDTMNAPRAPPQEIKSAGLPLLSPVFETRTPSPAANRQLDSKKIVNGAKPQTKENHAPQQQQQQQQQRRASHAQGQSSSPKEIARGNQQKPGAQSNDKGHKTGPVGNNPSGNWQQTNPKKRNKKKKAANSPNLSGEPLPMNAADRKGG